MESNYIKEQRFVRARKKVRKIKDFYAHLVVMCVALPIVIFINLKFSPEFHWFWIPVWAMSFSVIIHWISSFGFGADWEERKIVELIKSDKKIF